MHLTVSALLSPIQNRHLQGKLGAFEGSYEWEAASEPDLVYLCGLPALGLLDRYRPLAAPRLLPTRYQGKPWYFVDIVGRADDGRSARWAFNEFESFSGWEAVHLSMRLEGRSPNDLQWIRSGSHEASLALVRTGQADRAGIDSTMLDLDPQLLVGLTVMTSFGPWPAPPVMISRHLSETSAGRLAEQFADPAGGEWLLLEENHLDPIAAALNGSRR